jgi:dihydroorotate dehydrogenase
VGGIAGWEGVVESFLAGANAVQIGTAILQKDLRFFSDVIRRFSTYLKQDEFSEVSDLAGVADRNPA